MEIQSNKSSGELVDPKVLIIGSTASFQAINTAAHNVMNEVNPSSEAQIATGKVYNPDDQSTWLVTFRIMDGSAELNQLTVDEFISLIKSHDIIIVLTEFNSVNTYFENAIAKDPSILDRPIMIHLQSTTELVKKSSINGHKMLENIPNTVLGTPSNANSILGAVKNQNVAQIEAYKAQYPEAADWFDIALYTVSKGSVNFENLFNFVLKRFTEENGGTWPAKWNPNAYFTFPSDVLYRDGKVFTTMEEYLAEYPHDPTKPTVGVIEYDSPLFAGNMDHFEDMIDSLVSQGFNVIPAVAQWTGYYRTMVKFFAGAPNTTEYEANPQNYSSKVDAIVVFKSFALFYDVEVAKGLQLLENLDVPLFRAVATSSRTMGEWLVSDDGIIWSQAYYQIAMLERYGLIEPIMVSTYESTIDPITGATIKKYVSIPERMDKLSARIKNWTNLMYLENSEKIVALIYYNYPPGKQNIGASYLNVPETIIEMLKRLKIEGYIVDDIPESEEALIELMWERGINIANWAPGALEEMANNPHTILWDVDEYMAWFETLDPIAKKQVTEGPIGYIEEIVKLALQFSHDQTAIDATLKTIETWNKEMISLAQTYPEKSSEAIPLIDNMSQILKDIITNNGDISALWNNFYLDKTAFNALGIPGLNGWGEAPGNVMTVTKNGKQYMVIPGLFFGNIFIGPEPQRGWEADAGKFYHSTVVPPTHQYLAWYAYVNHVLNANAQVHLGRHATYEWLPRKQVLLSSFDFSDIMIANTPSIYIYIVDGVGEGLQAKRRGLAVIVDHLTPPLKVAKMNYGGFVELKGLVDQYEQTPDGNPMKDEYKNAIIVKIKEMNLASDLGLDENNISDDDIDLLHQYLLDLQQTLMPYGLHTFGLSWTKEEIALLATAMVSADGGIDEPSLQRLLAQENGWNFDNLTLNQAEQLNDQAHEMILQLLTGQKTISELTSNLVLQAKLNQALQHAQNIDLSFNSELNSLIDALNGKFITPGSANDPIRNPEAVPTGKNFYGLDDSMLPTRVAWDLGKRIADMALAGLDTMPEKIAAVVWCVETARDDGTMVSFVLRMMGVEPTWLTSGALSRMRVTPLTTLLSDLNAVRASKGLEPISERPRIDVVVTTSGLFRDLFPRLLINGMDRSYRVALAASYNTIIAQYPELKTSLEYALQTLTAASYTNFKGNESLSLNHIANNWVKLTQSYLELGLTAEESGEFAITRIFAPPVGDYGAGVNKAIEQSWTWETRDEVADVYLNRMSHSYSERNWGLSNPNLFKELLKDIDLAYHSRSTNLYGVLDNDDYFDYFGGLSMAIERVNGNPPNLNVLYYANPANPQIVSLRQFMTREMRTRYFNPEWIQGMMNEGYSGARTISNKFVEYLGGWQITNPDVVEDWMWNEVVDIYINDKYNIGVTEWLSTGNRVYSMMSIASTLLSNAHKINDKTGKPYWNTDLDTIRQITNTWASMVAQHGVNCDHHTCGDMQMVEWAMQYIDADIASQFREEMYRATKNAMFAPGGSDPGVTPGTPGTTPGTPGTTPGTPGTTPSTPSTPGSTASSGHSHEVSAESSQESASEAADSADSAEAGEEGAKSYEVTTADSPSSSQDNSMIYTIIGIISVLALVGAGFYFGPGRRS